MKALLVLLTLSAAAHADAPKGFVAYPKARQLCYQHITGNTMHIIWSTHATKDGVAKVVAHYEKELGLKATAQADGSKLIEVDKDRHVTVYLASKADKFPSCETKPKTGEVTIVMLSTAVR